MQKTSKIWFNGKFVDWSKARVHVLNHTMHYGTGAFEGLRFYNTTNGPAIFQLGRHIDRWLYSAKCIYMKMSYSKKELKEAIINLIKKNKIKSSYIRPIAYYGHGPTTVENLQVLSKISEVFFT